VEVEPRERRAERLALAQDRQPGEARLEPLQAQLLEQPDVVDDREAPLGVVIAAVLLGVAAAPEAASDAVLTDEDPLRWESFRWESFRWESFRWESFRWESFRRDGAAHRWLT
jgi:hypothetical protein